MRVREDEKRRNGDTAVPVWMFQECHQHGTAGNVVLFSDCSIWTRLIFLAQLCSRSSKAIYALIVLLQRAESGQILSTGWRWLRCMKSHHVHHTCSLAVVEGV